MAAIRYSPVNYHRLGRVYPREGVRVPWQEPDRAAHRDTLIALLPYVPRPESGNLRRTLNIRSGSRGPML